MGFKTNMSDGEQRIPLYGAFFTLVFAVGTHSILPLVWLKWLDCAVLVFWLLCVVSTSFQVWALEMLDAICGHIGRQIIRQSHAMHAKKVQKYSAENASDWEDTEDTSGSSDSWSTGINTPSETERSCRSSTAAKTTDTVRKKQTKSRSAGASNAIDAALISGEKASYIHASSQPLAPQDRTKQYVQQQARPVMPTERRPKADSHEQSRITTQQPESSKPETSKHTSKQTSKQSEQKHAIETSHISSSEFARSSHRQPQRPRSILKERAEHQPADIIILEIRKGTNFKKRLIVRMYRKSTFSHLKTCLKSDELCDDANDLAIRDEGGDYPVFDNDTPRSVSLLRAEIAPRPPESEVDEVLLGWVAALGYTVLGTHVGRTKITGLD